MFIFEIIILLFERDYSQSSDSKPINVLSSISCENASQIHTTNTVNIITLYILVPRAFAAAAYLLHN